METIIMIFACICFFMLIADSICKLAAIIAAVLSFPFTCLTRKTAARTLPKTRDDTAEADKRYRERIRHLHDMLNH